MKIQAQHKRKDTIVRMCTISNFVVNDNGKQILNLKIKIINISGYSVKLPDRVLTKYFVI